jgi:ribose 5-phosphate isomerase A
MKNLKIMLNNRINMLSQEEIKKQVGVYAAGLVETGTTIGLGTGSTVYWLIEELGKRVKQGLEIVIVPTSAQTAQLAKQADITVSNLDEVEKLAVTIDGADEIDPTGQLIKGGGGALLQEKIVASASEKLIIIADSSKLVERLGKFPLPVEVITFGYKQAQQKLLETGLCKEAVLRRKNGKIFITDHQHFILDCSCEHILDPAALNTAFHLIPGVVETGLFTDMATSAIIGFDDGRIQEVNFQ